MNDENKPSNGEQRWLSLVQSTAGMFLLVLLTYVTLAVFMFALAGRRDLPWFWLALGITAASHLVMVWTVFRHDRELARERLRPGPGEPFWDKVILTATGLLILANFAAAPLDVGRYHWTDSVPAPLQCAGLLGIAMGMALMSWAMAANTFFSKVVRIQEDRQQTVIQSGPYRFVRHPGYVGWALLWSSFNLALGSWLAVGISLLICGVLVVRTALEDRFLQQQLPGYQAYTRRVKWRLIPGIW